MKKALTIFVLLFAFLCLSQTQSLQAEEVIQVAELNRTPGIMHLSPDYDFPTFTQTGEAKHIKPGDPLYGTAILTKPPQDLFKGKKTVHFIQTLEENGKVLAKFEYDTPLRKIKGSIALPTNIIPSAKGDSPGEDWTALFALALNTLPAGQHTLTATIQSPDHTPLMMAKGDFIYEASGDGTANIESALRIASKRKLSKDRAADAPAPTHNFKLVNNCHKKKTVVIVEGTIGTQRYTLKPRKSVEVLTAPKGKVFLNKRFRINLESIPDTGSIDLCL